MSPTMPNPINPLGVHARTVSSDWTLPGAQTAVRRAANAGFDFIEVPVPASHELDAAATRRLLSSFGLRATVSLALTAGQDVSSDDDDVVQAGESALRAAVRFAADIGATWVGGVTFSKLGRYDHLPSAPGRASSLAVLGRTARAALTDGIEIGVEYVNRYESNLLNTAADTAAFLDELGEPNVRLHLDTYHANSEDPSLSSAVASAGSRLAYVHASESHRGALGTGSLDWAGLFEALAAHRFTGPITFESFSPAVVDPAMAIEVGLWRTSWTSADAVATDACSFLAHHLAAARGRTPSTIGIA